MKPLFSIFIFTLTFLSVSAQSDKQVDPNFRDSFKTIEISDWVGERFVFKQRHSSLQKYGYQSLKKAGDTFGRLSYTGYVGKIVKVTRVENSNFSSSSYIVSLTVEDTGEKLVATAYIGEIDGLVNFRDLEKARSIFVGKNIYRHKGSIQINDKETDKSSSLAISPFEPLEVISVETGELEPVRFNLRTGTGILGYVELALTGTNVSTILRDRNRLEDEIQLVPPPKQSAVESIKSYRPTAEAIKLAKENKDVLGWQNGWWRMSTIELTETFPELKKLPKREVFQSNYAEYYLSEYQVGSDVYQVFFLMDGITNRLVEVLFKSKEYPPDRPFTITFETLESLLTQKYGSPRYKNDDTKPGRLASAYKKRQWVFPTTTIELDYAFLQDIKSSVTIRYFPTEKSDANKL